MSKDASVAPRERVNIVYRPAEGDGREEVELPMKLLVMGDFTGRPDPRPIEEREPVSVNRENFDDVMQGQKVSLQVRVPNRLDEQDADDLTLQLDFQALDDFSPEAVIEQVPEMRRLLELREALRALKGPLANLPEFRRKIQEVIDEDAERTRLLAEIGGPRGRREP